MATLTQPNRTNTKLQTSNQIMNFRLQLQHNVVYSIAMFKCAENFIIHLGAIYFIEQITVIIMWHTLLKLVCTHEFRDSSVPRALLGLETSITLDQRVT